jgi:polyphosphate kinase 2 (PPK2 family)
VAHLPAAGEIVLFDRSWCNSRRCRACHGLLHRG